MAWVREGGCRGKGWILLKGGGGVWLGASEATVLAKIKGMKNVTKAPARSPLAQVPPPPPPTTTGTHKISQHTTTPHTHIHMLTD
jgi:hypothetical protein